MTSKTVRYTTTLSLDYLDELRALANKKTIPSVNHAINEALEVYLKSLKVAQYEASMKEAGRDKAFLSRTLTCADDFQHVDAEVSGEW